MITSLSPAPRSEEQQAFLPPLRRNRDLKDAYRVTQFQLDLRTNAFWRGFLFGVISVCLTALLLGGLLQALAFATSHI